MTIYKANKQQLYEFLDKMTDTKDINIDYLTPISEQSDRSESRRDNGYTKAHAPFANGNAKSKKDKGHLVNGNTRGEIQESSDNLENGDTRRLWTRNHLINGQSRSKSLPVHLANSGVRGERLQARITKDDPRSERSQARYAGSSGGTNVHTDGVAVSKGYQGLIKRQGEHVTQPYTTLDNDDSQYTLGGIPKGETTGLNTANHKTFSSKHSRKYQGDGIYNEVYDEIYDTEPDTPSSPNENRHTEPDTSSTPNKSRHTEPDNPSTPHKNRRFMIALASIIGTVVLAGATFAVVFFLKIKSSKSPVTFVEPDYTFNIGEPGNLTFELVNLTDSTELYISREFKVLFASTNQTSPNVEIANAHPHISVLKTELSNHYVRVNLLFDPVLCSDADGNSGIVKYSCSIKMTDSTWSNVTKRVRFQRLPGVPQLTLSREIINNKFTRADLPYVCEGELGDPRGQMIIESDFNGEFQAFLTVDNRNNSVGFIFDDKLTNGSCGNYQTLPFAFHKANMSMNFKRLRCSIKPSSEILNSDVKESDAGIINVVPDDWCKDATSLTPLIDHPYACHLGVMCSADGIVLGVPFGCSEDKCYNTQNMAYGCYTCNCTKGGPLPTATTTVMPTGK